MLNVSKVRDITVVAGFRSLIPGGHAIVAFINFVLDYNLEGELLPVAPNTDKVFLSQHIETIFKQATARANISIDVPGVKTGDIAEFVIFAKEKNLWPKFREAAKDN